MEELVPTTSWHVSRRVALPLGTATVAFDRVVGRPHQRSAVGLRDAFVTAPTGAVPRAGRQLHGRLRTTPLRRPLPVELELTPWSDAESELGVRPGRPPVGASADRYWRWAAETLEQLHAGLLAAAPAAAVGAEPLRRAS